MTLYERRTLETLLSVNLFLRDVSENLMDNRHLESVLVQNYGGYYSNHMN